MPLPKQNVDRSQAPWRARARCREADPDMFFPPKGAHDLVDNAKEICSRCPVQEQCLSFAMKCKNSLPGVWGGTSERDRRKLRRRKSK